MVSYYFLCQDLIINFETNLILSSQIPGNELYNH
jgi:hypothetical protein